MNKPSVIHLYNGTLVSITEKKKPLIHAVRGEARMNAEGERPDRGDNTVRGSAYRKPPEKQVHAERRGEDAGGSERKYE